MQLRDPLTGRLRSARANPFAFLAMGATLALIPWTLIYISQLPDHHTAKHWNLAWAGFDIALCIALGVTAWCALRERALLIVALIVSSTLLVCDAWFDVATSLDTADEGVTLVTALAVELPLAGYFALRSPTACCARPCASAAPSTPTRRCAACHSRRIAPRRRARCPVRP